MAHGGGHGSFLGDSWDHYHKSYSIYPSTGISWIEVIKLNRDLVIDPSPKFDPDLLQIRIMALPKAAYGTHQIGVLTIKFKDIQTYKSWKKFIQE